MFKIALVVFRECLEISIILGIICAATKSIQNAVYYIVGGIVAGTILSAFLAFFINSLTFTLSGFGEEIFDVLIIMLTVVVVGATAIWIKRSASKMSGKMSNLSSKIEKGLAPRIILTSVVATTIFREVTEIVLFIHALASAYDLSPMDYILGFGLGLGAGIVAATCIYYGLSRFAMKSLLRITFVLLVLIAASLASEAAGILTSIGFLDVYNEPLWDSSWLISDFSMVGRMLKILVGYTAQPNSMQILFYFTTIIVIYLCSKFSEDSSAKTTS